jgi:hypothetical protein
LDHIAKITPDTTVAFVIPLVALLTPLSVMWREEHLGISVYST